MPFEFNGEAPSFGSNSTSEAFTSFSFGSSSTPAPQPPAYGGRPSFGSTSFGSTSPPWAPGFGSAPSFGSTSNLSGTGSFGTTLLARETSSTSQSPTSGAAEPKQGDAQPTTSPAPTAPYTPKGPICRALDRAQTERPALFGKSEIEADRVVAGYLEKMTERDGCSKDDAIEGLWDALDKVHEEIPEGMGFLKYVFGWATGAPTEPVQNLVAPHQPRPPEKYPLEEDKEPKGGDAGGDDGKAPDFYDEIPFGTPFYSACQTAIGNHIHPGSFYHYNSYNLITEDISGMIADGAHRDDVKQFLTHGAFGIFTPSTNLQKDVEELVDDLYEIVHEVKEEFKNGWKVKGRDEQSYFAAFNGPMVGSTGAGYYMPPRTYKPEYDQCCPDLINARRKQYRSQKRHVDGVFRFMDLPAEMRNIVYKLLLSPGEVSFVSCAHHMPLDICPILTTGLLRVSKQVNQETEGLIYENAFVANLHPGQSGRTVLHRTQIPEKLLPKITHLSLVLDCTQPCRPKDANWTPIQDLTALKTLKITGLEETKHPVPVDMWTTLLHCILEDVPAACQVEFGMKTWLAEKHVRVMKNILTDAKMDRAGLNHYRVEEAVETEIGKLDEAFQALPEGFVRSLGSGKKVVRITPATWKGGLPAGVKDMVDIGGLVMPADWVKKKKVGNVEVFDQEAEAEIRTAWDVGEN